VHFISHLVSGHPISYAVVFAVVALDAVLPFVQAEAVVITAAVLAAQGDLLVWLVWFVAACGGLLGDNVCYLIGRRVGPGLSRRWFSRGRRQHYLRRAERGVRRRGGLLIVLARFIPVGRTATTLAAGTLGMPWRRFVIADAIAAGLWAAYAVMLGYVGGSSFEHDSWKPLAVAFALAAVIAIGAEAYRRVQKHRGRDVLSGELS
jgi:membrane protein DedA with SNARE-associated domain